MGLGLRSGLTVKVKVRVRVRVSVRVRVRVERDRLVRVSGPACAVYEAAAAAPG